MNYVGATPLAARTGGQHQRNSTLSGGDSETRRHVGETGRQGHPVAGADDRPRRRLSGGQAHLHGAPEPVHARREEPWTRAQVRGGRVRGAQRVGDRRCEGGQGQLHLVQRHGARRRQPHHDRREHKHPGPGRGARGQDPPGHLHQDRQQRDRRPQRHRARLHHPGPLHHRHGRAGAGRRRGGSQVHRHRRLHRHHGQAGAFGPALVGHPSPLPARPHGRRDAVHAAVLGRVHAAGGAARRGVRQELRGVRGRLGAFQDPAGRRRDWPAAEGRNARGYRPLLPLLDSCTRS